MLMSYTGEHLTERVHETGEFVSKQLLEMALLDSTLLVIMHTLPVYLAAKRIQPFFIMYL